MVVPRMHHFAVQTGHGDHIGSIPIYRIRTPNLTGPARMVKRAFDVARRRRGARPAVPGDRGLLRRRCCSRAVEASSSASRGWVATVSCSSA